MDSKRYFRKTVVRFQSQFQPEQVWTFSTHPEFETRFDKEPCYHNSIPDNFELAVGKHWTEIHTGEDCNGDKIQCKIIEIQKDSKFKTIRHQAGIQNITTIELKSNAEGTLISTEQSFAPSLKSFNALHLISWFMLATGLLTKFSFKPDDDLFWFEQMEKAVATSEHTTG